MHTGPDSHQTKGGRPLAEMPRRYSDAVAMARDIFARMEGEVRLALPLGLGKPVTLVNAMTRLAAEDPALRLTIFTALTLQRPQPSSDIERRFLEPAMDRLFGAYPDLHYARMIREGTLPANIEVSEFFFHAGTWLGNEYAQQHYIAANYTHARDVLIAQRPNVLAQLLAPGEEPGKVSLSCNTDISADLFALRRKGEMEFLAVGEMNAALPCMPGPQAELPAASFGLLLEPETEFELFSAVRRPVSDSQYAIGLHVSRMVKDGGTLQIGIGAIGDAVAQALLLRDRDALAPLWSSAPMPLRGEGTAPFETGLYGVTEMLVGGMLSLFDAGILRREVSGAAIHAGFFVEARDVYRRLREMPRDRRAKIAMMPVSFTNALYGDEAAKRAARVDARFVNGAMQVSLLGDAMSDSAKPGQVVSGVGGQFNFFEQAFALENARAILTLPATRTSGGRTESNIVWQVPVTTVPRHMRDVVVTEYGVAALRGQTDEEVVRRLICIADSRFQETLAKEARSAGKLARDWQVPEAHRRNKPGALGEWLLPHRGILLPDFPFGSDFDAVERLLLPALSRLGNASGNWRDLAGLLGASFGMAPHPREQEAMARMGFDPRSRLLQPLQARALRGALRQVAER
jgi:hypothetical protein